MINVNEMSQSFYTVFMLMEALCKQKCFCHNYMSFDHKVILEMSNDILRITRIRFSYVCLFPRTFRLSMMHRKFNVCYSLHVLEAPPTAPKSMAEVV